MRKYLICRTNDNCWKWLTDIYAETEDEAVKIYEILFPEFSSFVAVDDEELL